MKSGVKLSGGFTIIEVLIVLGVSAFLLATAVYYVSGRVSDTEFQQSVNTLNSQILGLIDDVADSTTTPTKLLGGQTIDDFVCTSSHNSSNTFTVTKAIASSNFAPGTNSDCTYFGDAIDFYYPGASATPTPYYKSYPIIGLTQYGVANEAYDNTGLTDDYLGNNLTKATLLTLSGTNDNTQKNLEYGLNAYSVWACDYSSSYGTTQQPTEGIGVVINSEGTYQAGASLGSLYAGSFQLGLYGLGAGNISSPWATQTGDIDTALGASTVPSPVQDIYIFLQDNSGHYATLKILSGSGQITTALTLSSTQPTPGC